MKHKSLLFLLAFVFLSSLVVGSQGNTAAAEKVYKWKFESHMPPSDDNVAISHPKLAEMLEKNTSGRIKVTVYPGGAIVNGNEIPDAVATGVLQMGLGSPAYWAGNIPATMVEDGLPYSWRNTQEVMEILWDYGLIELLRPEYAKYGVYLLGDVPAAGGGGSIITSKKISSLSELKGLKIRSWGIFQKMVEKMGASPITMALTEAYTAMTTGTIDGTLHVWSPIYDLKFYEPCPYALLPPIVGDCTHNLYVNMDVWNSLDDDLKTIVELTVRDWANWHARWFQTRYAIKKFEILRDKGMLQFTTVSEADQAMVLKYAMEIWDGVAGSDPVSAKAVKLVGDYLKEVGAIK